MEIKCKVIDEETRNIRDILFEVIGKALYDNYGKLSNGEVTNIIIDLMEYYAKKVMYKQVNIKLTKDGNQYCFLLGRDLQEGIAGFGDTILGALDDFKQRWGNDMKSDFGITGTEQFFKEHQEDKEDKK